MSKLLSYDTKYRDWIQEVSKRFRQSKIRAAVKVNDEMLRFYWNLGNLWLVDLIQSNDEPP